MPAIATRSKCSHSKTAAKVKEHHARAKKSLDDAQESMDAIQSLIASLEGDDDEMGTGLPGEGDDLSDASVI